MFLCDWFSIWWSRTRQCYILLATIGWNLFLPYIIWFCMTLYWYVNEYCLSLLPICLPLSSSLPPPVTLFLSLRLFILANAHHWKWTVFVLDRYYIYTHSQCDRHIKYKEEEKEETQQKHIAQSLYKDLWCLLRCDAIQNSIITIKLTGNWSTWVISKVYSYASRLSMEIYVKWVAKELSGKWKRDWMTCYRNWTIHITHIGYLDCSSFVFVPHFVIQLKTFLDINFQFRSMLRKMRDPNL